MPHKCLQKEVSTSIIFSLILQFGNVTGYEKWLFIIKPLTRGEDEKQLIFSSHIGTHLLCCG